MSELSETMSETKTKAPPAAIFLPCPCCGEEQANMSLELYALDDDEAQFTCHCCNENFGRRRVRAMIEQWTKVLAWIDSAPNFEGVRS